MIARYTRPEMGAIWSEEAKFGRWLKVELAVCRAWSRRGAIPKKSLKVIERKAGFSIAAIDRHEKKLDHDVLAFLAAVRDRVGREARFIHMGMTSYDVVDTALALAMKEASAIVIQGLMDYARRLKAMAAKHRDTVMTGRTHGVHAEPTSLGLKFALHYAEALRNIDRLKAAAERVAVGKISGAVGNYAHLPPALEESVLHSLGLKAAAVSTQVVQRDRHAELLTVMAIIGGSLEKLGTEVRNLQRTEILELEEGFKKGQRGSSAMPHKKNPILSERIGGLARVVRGYALAGLENIALWHERDLTNSSAERIIVPDAFILVDYMLSLANRVLDGLVVREDRMKENLGKTGGLIYSQRVMLALVKAGMTRERAYKLVQACAMANWEEGGSFRDRLANEIEVARLLKPDELDGLFDPKYYLRNVNVVLRRLGIR